MSISETLLNFFISSAHADTGAAAGPAGSSNLSLLLMLLFFGAFIYFGVWRPQSKRAKEQRDLLSSIAKGDEVLTTGGLIGRVTKLSDNFVVLAVADNVEITLQKSAIASALPKGTMKSI